MSTLSWILIVLSIGNLGFVLYYTNENIKLRTELKLERKRSEFWFREAARRGSK